MSFLRLSIKTAGGFASIRSASGEAPAVGREAAAVAGGLARGADGAAVQHDPVAEVGRFLRRQDRAQLLLDLGRFLAAG